MSEFEAMVTVMESIHRHRQGNPTFVSTEQLKDRLEAFFEVLEERS
ncbi:MAG: hypothetical protein AAB270_08640 [Chloroflexota bacterium]